ncbi:MAG: iron-sulfur cluster assembly scaffold protein [Acidobacteria bacterium]|nr:iron-sulfur cluster assembly scaffold protein [Acidobacteriota bacterium]
MPARFLGRFTSPVLDHFHHPRNAGVAAHYNRSFLEQENPWHIRLLFTLRVEQGYIREVKFKAQSCVTTVACASALTEMAQGKDVATALAIRPEQLSEALGGVPHEKMYCCHLAIDTLRRALEFSVQTDSEVHSRQGESS